MIDRHVTPIHSSRLTLKTWWSFFSCKCVKSPNYAAKLTFTDRSLIFHVHWSWHLNRNGFVYRENQICFTLKGKCFPKNVFTFTNFLHCSFSCLNAEDHSFKDFQIIVSKKEFKLTSPHKRCYFSMLSLSIGNDWGLLPEIRPFNPDVKDFVVCLFFSFFRSGHYV